MATDPDKKAAIRDWPTPHNVKDVRRYVPGFAHVAKPLHHLTEKGRRFDWAAECEAAFQLLKQLLTSAPLLTCPSGEGKFILGTDASDCGIGCVFSQEQSGEERVIAYYSRTLSRPERNYCVTRKELLAVVVAIAQFHHYLYGRRFVVRSDHASLQWLMQFKQPEGQTARSGCKNCRSTSSKSCTVLGSSMIMLMRCPVCHARAWLAAAHIAFVNRPERTQLRTQQRQPHVFTR